MHSDVRKITVPPRIINNDNNNNNNNKNKNNDTSLIDKQIQAVEGEREDLRTWVKERRALRNGMFVKKSLNNSA